jgi:alpha,alpha-trehalose phosphorylase
MISHPAIAVEPWAVRETALDLSLLAQSESLFALSNGHIGIRGNLDEGEPHGLPGTYLNGVYELRPLPYAESQYGQPESGQTMIDVTNGKIIRLLVGDEPLDLRYGVLRRHERVLDLRGGTLQRIVEWESPAHRTIRVTSTRLVSFTHRAIMAIAYEVELLDGPATLVVQSELVANESVPARAGDPRTAAALESPLESELYQCRHSAGVLVHHTRRSGLRLAAAMSHEVSGSEQMHSSSESWPDVVRNLFTDTIEPGQKLRMVKYVAYGWSETRTLPALRDQVAAALFAAKEAGWNGLVAQQRAYLDDFWSRADIEIEGDSELQQAVRFALFQVLSSAARAEGRGIPSKGLTGNGYDGHTFWDGDTYVVPVLTYTLPSAAADYLRWRKSTLPIAEARARSDTPAPCFRGARSMARKARGTGPPAPRRFTSTPTSRSRRSTMYERPATRPSNAMSRWRSSSRQPGCGARSVITTSMATSGSTASPGPTNTALLPTTTCTPT